ncbi:MAG: universal stress protein [Geminicoccaceae bacterium]|nr:universal stress protein [Geminicoccaceae bacterium]
MTYRTIVLQLVDDPSNEARLRAALALAQRFGARLIAVHVTPPPVVPVGYGEGAAYVGPEILEVQREAAKAVAERLEATFNAVCEPGSGAIWRHLKGDPGERLARIARTADLTIGPRFEARGLDALVLQPIEQTALSAGGPVLLVPVEGFVPDLGRTVLVGWNGRKEAARALKDALPFLTSALEVELLAIGEEAGESLDDAVAMLERHGVAARGRRVAEETDAGGQLLARMEEVGADLLVMGIYSHARLRELVLGGATRHVLRYARGAVLFSC